MGRMVLFAKNKQETCFKWVEGLQDNINDINKKLDRVTTEINTTKRRRKKRKTRTSKKKEKIRMKGSRRKMTRNQGLDAIASTVINSGKSDLVEPSVIES